MSFMPDDLLRCRSEFPILERTNYMISNSLGAMPCAVYDALHAYADVWATCGVRAWEERWWMLALEVGNELGALMNAPQDSVSLHQNVTTCQAVVASCFGFSGKRNKVVYSDMNFPSVMYFWEAQRQYGAQVHMVKTDDGVTVPTDRLLDAIDEQTLIVPISHVIFRSSYINDAKAIIDKAHKVGAHVVLDTFQSLGTVSIDMPDSQQVSRELLARDILVDWRPKAGVRFSPHFYNTDAEVDAAMAAVADILKARAVTA